ncbi:6-bladed beta-propeller [Parabacteroides pacaensis]|uniref:6-bladed beta-propeller n=1 Tax=Parabacteroides pacaensis TaxID=2086575 RepID=UPI000D0E676C|nr:6-bladed beta-propeller [Parabacteroides pacaensis]
MKGFKIVVGCMAYILLSCTGTKTDLSENKVCNINVDVKDYCNEIGETGAIYFENCRYVQLETDTNSMIGEVTKLILTKDRIYILDMFKAKSVFIFDSNGAYINKIFRFGQGAEEYLQLTDIFYNEKEETINLSDIRGKIMSFDKDGHMVKKQIKFPLRIFNMEQDKNGNYILNSKNTSSPSFPESINVFSPAQEKIYSAFPIQPEWESKVVKSNSDFSYFAGDIFYTPQLTTDVYKLGLDSVSQVYHYNFGEHTFPDEYKTPEYFLPSNKKDLMNYVKQLDNFCETKKYLFALFVLKGQKYMNIYDKIKESSKTHHLSGNPIDFGGFGEIISFTENSIVTIQDPNYYLGRFDDKELLAERGPEIQKLKDKFTRPLKEDDNPILCIYKIKD